jgi:hypothetical protein
VRNWVKKVNRNKWVSLPVEEVAMFIFFIFAVITISLPFMALFFMSKGFRWILVLIMIWISAGYLVVRTNEDTENPYTSGEISRKDRTTGVQNEVERTEELISRGETGLTLSQDMVYERMGNTVRKLMIISGISEGEFMASKEEPFTPLKRLLRLEKRKGSFNPLKRIGLYRDRRFIQEVSFHLDLIERWLNENI